MLLYSTELDRGKIDKGDVEMAECQCMNMPPHNRSLPSVAGENGMGSFSFPRMECSRSRVSVEFQETGGESKI